MRILASPNIAPKDWILREYDHEVQGGSVTKAISGIEQIAVNDAAVVRPNPASERCVAIGLGINPFYSDIDPYWTAGLAIDEALRNIICAGGRLEKTFILDNFSWGSPQDARLLGGLVRAARACYDFSLYYGVPFISGKDSLYNEYDVGKKHISIPGTLLVSALSVMADWKKTLTANFKEKGNLIYIVGSTKPELGSSEYFRGLGIDKGSVPKIDKRYAKKIFTALGTSIQKGLASACHDCSEGGLVVAVAEMCIGGSIGANIFLEEAPGAKGLRDYEALFSESASRFIVEVPKKNQEAFEKELANLPFGLIGCICDEPKLVIHGKACRQIVDVEVAALKEAWLKTFEAFR